MRHYLSILVCFASAQTIKSEEGHRMFRLEKRIAAVQAVVNALKEKREGLLEKYSPEYREVVAVDSSLAELNAIIAKLEAARRELSKKPLTIALPSNEVALLKMLLLQNERIIELLEGLENGAYDVKQLVSVDEKQIKNPEEHRFGPGNTGNPSRLRPECGRIFTDSDCRDIWPGRHAGLPADCFRIGRRRRCSAGPARGRISHRR